MTEPSTSATALTQHDEPKAASLTQVWLLTKYTWCNGAIHHPATHVFAVYADRQKAQEAWTALAQDEEILISPTLAMKYTYSLCGWAITE